ncbi:hypothetical protein [Tichowtungia aerotolerans]|uniref:Uncharacterized protein n=1 Tax=Tichowtungia aerotolerans TaxID=2697043 RepID=A0A6P1MBA3_9BACT|nr:hypothetical protein [Tichowtungia aerotolerans]QHI69378.1 hypothetical protein GT409_07905 [Tichowtungia aerotolerans]
MMKKLFIAFMAGCTHVATAQNSLTLENGTAAVYDVAQTNSFNGVAVGNNSSGNSLSILNGAAIENSANGYIGGGLFAYRRLFLS